MPGQKKIVIMKYGGLGDHVLASPTIKHLRRLEPDAHITVLSSKGCLDFYAANPHIDAALPAPDFKDFVRGRTAEQVLIDQYIQRVLPGEFDLLYNPSHDYDLYFAGLVARWIRARRKLTFRQSYQFVPGYDSNSFYTELLDRPALPHVADYQNIFFESEYGQAIDPHDTELAVPGDLEEKLFARLKPVIFEERVVAIHGTGSMAPRELTLEQLEGLVAGLCERGYLPVLLGHPRVMQGVPGLENLSGLFSIPETAYFLSRCAAVVCVDSGVKHLASLCRLPICEISHIPLDLMRLNGPYILEPYKYSALQYWAPKGGDYPQYQVVYPESGLFWDDDIEEGICINSISPQAMLEKFDLLEIAPQR
jgi:ADP-heptose:LPS heptosyltransferase